MQTTLAIAEILVSVLLILTVLLQVRGQGTGLFASAESTFRVRRGLERVLFQFTIVLVVLFLLISILSVRLAE
ncbi:MAG: preprotein translocase subunit SecG [Dehalococcoidia bacterium]|nr:preprotein translocase subunit SecG [Dehalococcoidia bacterium]MDW8119454.1 preprotein translocase subunit SecG [Chloroflexota bacterium]